MTWNASWGWSILCRRTTAGRPPQAGLDRLGQIAAVAIRQQDLIQESLRIAHALEKLITERKRAMLFWRCKEIE